jgi:PilZ domain
MLHQSFKETEPALIFGDRRADRRISIEVPVTFEVVETGDIGQGVGVNISSTGLSFRTPELLAPGCLVNVRMSWRILGRETTLAAYGQVVRSKQGAVGMQVLRHEFRRSKAPKQEQSGKDARALRRRA